MNLKIMLPSQVFADQTNVVRAVVETSQGSWGILPHRRDCVAALVSGVLTFETRAGVAYVAVDNGVFVKTGAELFVSVRRAVMGTDLEHVRETVEREFAVLEETAREVRHVSEKLESAFLRRIVDLHRE